MSTPSERRLAPRRVAHLVAEIEADGGTIDCGVSRDASATGLLILTRSEMPAGQQIAVRLFVPGEKKRRALKASVVRCERLPASERDLWSYRIAISIVEPPKDLQQIVEKLSATEPSE